MKETGGNQPEAEEKNSVNITKNNKLMEYANNT